MTVILQSYDLFDIAQGPAILLVGILIMLLWATVTFRNPLGVMAWGFTILLFIFSSLFGIGLELTWIGVAVTTIITIVGVTVRMSR